MLSFGMLCLSYGCKIMDNEMSQFDCLFGIMHELEFGGNFYKVVEGNMWHGFWIKNKSQLQVYIFVFLYKHLCKILVVTCNFDLELD